MEVARKQQSVLRRFVDDGWDYMASKAPAPPPTAHKQDGFHAAARSGGDHRFPTPHTTTTTDSGKDSGTGGPRSRFIKQTSDELRTMSMAPKDLEIRRMFNTYDENKDGQISETELGNAMKKLDLEVSDDAISTMISIVDKNRDGVVDFEEFVALQTPTNHKNYSNGNNSSSNGNNNITHHGKKENKSASVNSPTSVLENGHGEEEEEDDDITLLKETFSIFDKNHDGFISSIELQSILQRLGITKGASLKDCQKMITSVDRNGDGRVDFEEFKELMIDLF